MPPDVSCVAVDGVQSLVAMGTRAGAVYVMGRPGVEAVLAPSTPGAGVVAVHWVLNEGIVVAVLEDSKILIWSVEKRSLIAAASLRQRDGLITTTTLPPGSKNLLVGTSIGSVFVLSVSNGKWLTGAGISAGDVMGQNIADVLDKTKLPVVVLTPCPVDASVWLLGYKGGALITWSVRKKKVICQFGKPLLKGLTTGAWTPDGTAFASGYQDGRVALWKSSAPDTPYLSAFRSTKGGGSATLPSSSPPPVARPPSASTVSTLSISGPDSPADNIDRAPINSLLWAAAPELGPDGKPLKARKGASALALWVGGGAPSSDPTPGLWVLAGAAPDHAARAVVPLDGRPVSLSPVPASPWPHAATPPSAILVVTDGGALSALSTAAGRAGAVSASQISVPGVLAWHTDSLTVVTSALAPTVEELLDTADGQESSWPITGGLRGSQKPDVKGKKPLATQRSLQDLLSSQSAAGATELYATGTQKGDVQVWSGDGGDLTPLGGFNTGSEISALVVDGDSRAVLAGTVSGTTYLADWTPTSRALTKVVVKQDDSTTTGSPLNLSGSDLASVSPATPGEGEAPIIPPPPPSSMGGEEEANASPGWSVAVEVIGHGVPVSCVCLAAGMDKAAIGYEDGAVAVVDMVASRGGMLLKWYIGAGAVSALAFGEVLDASGEPTEMLYAGTSGGGVVAFNLESLSAVGGYTTKHGSKVLALGLVLTATGSPAPLPIKSWTAGKAGEPSWASGTPTAPDPQPPPGRSLVVVTGSEVAVRFLPVGDSASSVKISDMTAVAATVMTSKAAGASGGAVLVIASNGSLRVHALLTGKQIGAPEGPHPITPTSSGRFPVHLSSRGRITVIVDDGRAMVRGGVLKDENDAAIPARSSSLFSAGVKMPSRPTVGLLASWSQSSEADMDTHWMQTSAAAARKANARLPLSGGKLGAKEQSERSELFAGANTDGAAEKKAKAKAGTSGAHGAAMNALVGLGKRGEKLEELGTKAAEMEAEAADFASNAAELARLYENKKWWQI